MPIGNDLYKVGATFNHADKTSIPSIEGRDELIEKLKKVLDTPFQIVAQAAGIRPAVKDRRPMVGIHPKFLNLVVLNGLGTRGVMISPTIAKNLFRHLEVGESLDPEIDIKRFDKK
jgi:glycine oxidase